MKEMMSLAELLEAYDEACVKGRHLQGLPELSEDTLRYYQQKNIFKPEGRSGKEARYSENALWRIIFTKLVQFNSDIKITLSRIASILSSIDPGVTKRVAQGKEPVVVESILGSDPGNEAWASYSRHPRLEVRVNGPLTPIQEEQVRLATKLLGTILDS